MADNKKKAKRVATLFGKQKVTTTPEIAAKIKSGEIDPATHSINKDGKFAPKRKAVVGGLGIVPTAGKLGSTVNTIKDSNVTTVGKAGFKATSEATDDSYDKVSGYSNSKAPKATMDSVAQTAVPKVDKTTGQEITPAQNLALQEQKAVKIAPFKADLESMTVQLNALMDELDAADDDEKIGAARTKIEKIKSSLSATNE